MIYTTPLKALSNQKLYEMRLRFGTERVGLQTGDATLNVDRDIVVMTTEILRNIMYRTEPGTDGVFPFLPCTKQMESVRACELAAIGMSLLHNSESDEGKWNVVEYPRVAMRSMQICFALASLLSKRIGNSTFAYTFRSLRWGRALKG